MIIVYYLNGDLIILFTEINRSLVFSHNKVRKRLTRRILVSYSWKYEWLPRKYIGRNLTEETVRKVESIYYNKIGYLYSL
jgi:hypothetical protein